MKSTPIGFVFVTCSRPNQIARIVSRLNSMFDHPPIAFHHDFGKCRLEGVEGNITFVRPHINTGWGDVSVIDATVKAIERLYSFSDPDRFVLLSETCYPVRNADAIISDLAVYDANIQHYLIKYGEFPFPWQEHCYSRYCVKSFNYPSVTRKLKPTWKKKKITNPNILRHLTPFNSGFNCYAGSQWFSGSRKAAELILSFYKSAPALRAHYVGRKIPDESYFQTVLGNSGLNISAENHRFVKFIGDRTHPEILTISDLPDIFASGAHFARKFESSDVFDEIDRAVG